MILKRVGLLLCPIVILLSMIPTATAPGSCTVDIYENQKEVIFEEGQESQTISMDGAVDYTGISVTSDTVELSCSFDLGESSIFPEEMKFQTTGSEEFTVVLIIPNSYENGTIGILNVRGVLRSGGSIQLNEDSAGIIIINHSHNINDTNDLNNSKNLQEDNTLSGIGGVLIVSAIIVVIAVIIIVIYKKISK